MNRADRLLSVLRDGREHSRQDVFDAVGFMLTNNAAAELRAAGHSVTHRRKNGVDIYQWRPSLDAASATPQANPPFLGDGGADAASSETPNPHRADAEDRTWMRDDLSLEFLASGQLSFEEAAA